MQQVPANTALTGGLIFLDASGATTVGPIGTLSSSVTLLSLGLSSDGQSYNFTSPSSGNVTLTWTDPSGQVPSFSADFSDQPPPPAPAVSGSFGPAAPGTTA
jgi:hypothetical protein